MTYQHNLSSDFVSYLFRGLKHVGIQYTTTVTIVVGKLMWHDLTNNQMPPAKRTKVDPPARPPTGPTHNSTQLIKR